MKVRIFHNIIVALTPKEHTMGTRKSANSFSTKITFHFMEARWTFVWLRERNALA